MLNWHDWAVCCAPILDSREMTTESKSITLDVSDRSEITVRVCPSVLDTIDTSKIQFTSLELKDLERTGVLTLKTNCWKWKLN